MSLCYGDCHLGSYEEIRRMTVNKRGIYFNLHVEIQENIKKELDRNK